MGEIFLILVFLKFCFFNIYIRMYVCVYIYIEGNKCMEKLLININELYYTYNMGRLNLKVN